MFSTAYKRYALGMLTAVYALNLVDRGVMSVLLQPIKEDLHLSDTQLGMVTGVAFALFYATMGVPIARWADRSNRVTITSIAIGLWGLTVMACMLVTNYFHLVLARIAAAIGESGCKPPTYSLVGDYFREPASRTRAMSIYIAAGPLSALISFSMAGWLNEIYGWRLTFFLIGIPGLILAILVKLTLVEPRETRERVVQTPPPAPPMRSVLGVLWHQQSCRHLCIALVLLYTMSQGLNPWFAAFMIRSHGMGTAELGLLMGLIFGLSGIAGLLLGGYVSSRWFSGNERDQMRLCAYTVAAVVPFFVAFLLVPHKYMALAALVPLVMILSSFLGPVYTLMQRLVPDEMRATVLAVVMLLSNLIGMGIGPQMVGVLSDLFKPTLGVDSLRYAMLAVSFVAVWSGYHFWRVGQTVAGDLATVGRRIAVPRAERPSRVGESLPAGRLD